MEEVRKRILTIGDKAITYTHIYPTLGTKIKLNWKERIRVLFGSPLELNLNIYLDTDKVVHTTAVLSTIKSLENAQKKKLKK